jgi:hypothetical protein
MMPKRIPALIAGFAFLVLLAVGLPSCSSTTSPSNAPTNKTFTSSVDNSHSHTVTIENAEVQSPLPAGISKTTSSVSGHTHSLTITQAQLTTVNGGGSVTITTGSSDVGGTHTHTFTITKWF